MNTDLIVFRSTVVKLVRQFFDQQGFLEVQTPRLIGLPGQEPHLDPLWTEVHVPNLPSTVYRLPSIFPAALITSPEYAMKKLLGEGMDKIYDLGPCFRDGEPWDGSHDVEFLLLEWYRRAAGLEELMRDAEDLIKFVTSKSTNSGSFSKIDVPFRRLTVRQAMLDYAGIELDPLLENREAMARVAKEHSQSVSDEDTWDDLFFKLFLSEVEPKLGWDDDRTAWRPTFLYDYPACMAALARRNPHNPRYALRVELYIGDLELANGFAELSDPVEQHARFEEERALRSKLGKRTWALDERFLTALPNMGDAAGIAFGVDRLAMLLAGVGSLQDLMPIPIKQRFDEANLD